MIKKILLQFLKLQTNSATVSNLIKPHFDTLCKMSETLSAKHNIRNVTDTHSAQIVR